MAEERIGYIAGWTVSRNIDQGDLKIIPYIHDKNLWFLEYIPKDTYTSFFRTTKPFPFYAIEYKYEQFGFRWQDLKPITMEPIDIGHYEKKKMNPYGYVYVIQAESGGPIKIGFSGHSCANMRLKEIQHFCPYKLHVLFESANKQYKDESALHRKYKDFHSHYEWFDEKIIPLLKKDFEIEN
jgi:hypothetical protein